MYNININNLTRAKNNKINQLNYIILQKLYQNYF